MGAICSGIRLQPEYIRTPSGILKIIELLCDLLSVILCGAAPTIEDKGGHKGFFLFVSILALIITLVIFALALLSVQKLVLVNAWPYIEIGWCAFIALFYFIASIIVATIAKYNGAYGAAAFFGFAAFITYIADAVNEFRTRDSRPTSNNSPQYDQRYAPDNNRPQPTY